MPEQIPQSHHPPHEVTPAQIDAKIHEALLPPKAFSDWKSSQSGGDNEGKTGLSAKDQTALETTKMQEEEEREKRQKLLEHKEKFLAWANKVGLSEEEVNEKARFTKNGIEWDGDLNLRSLTSLKKGVLPEHVGGIVYLNSKNFSQKQQEKIQDSYPRLNFKFANF